MTDTATASSCEGRVLAVVGELVRELEAGRIKRVVTPASSIDRDLGIGSLERVELLLRLERMFGVRLAEDVLASAVTVGDLVRAIESASPESTEEAPAPSAAEQGAGRAAPTSARTLVEVLQWHVQRSPERVHIFLREDDGHEYQMTYADLWRDAQGVAAGLHASGVARGECVALLLRTERSFFASYCGTLLAGAVPVPLYPPFRADQIEEYASRQAAILRNAEARVLVTFDRAERVAGLLKPLAPTLASVTTADALRRLGGRDAGVDPSIPADLLRVPSVPPDALALIQYTSGSTDVPKGVALSHENLLANIRAFGQALAVRPDDVGVSWLPLYHDMGLIGMWLGALFHGSPVVVMSPLSFLSRPSRWLRAFHVHRGTLSAAPNFAYDLCVRKVTDDEVAGLDLSSWRAALNGAEAVSAETIQRFTARFTRYGFQPQSMCPVYGLAETSLCLTVPELDEVPRVDRIAREPFQRSRTITPAAAGEPSLAFVGCGKAVPTTDVRIVDDRGHALDERREGRIQFRGPSATRGYHRNPEATAELIEDGWLNTGDLGYFAEGYIYITGRRKDLIIAGGRNIYPQEIEDAVAEIAGIRRGCVAAFGSYDPQRGTERLVVVAESRERDANVRASLEAEAIRRVVDIVGVPPDAVVIAPPGSIPKTSSGKIRARNTTRELYEQNRLSRGRASAAWQWARLILINGKWRVERVIGLAFTAAFTLYCWSLGVFGLLLLRVLLPFAGKGVRGGAIVRAWCRTMFRVSTFPVEFVGEERIRDLDGAVYVANHASYMDALLLRAVLPARVRLAAKTALLSYPVIGPVIAASNVISVTRGRESSADELTRVVREGGSFAIFPEGTFMRAPGLLPFRLGAFRAAVDAGRPVVPIALKNTRRSWPDETWLIRRVPLKVVIGEPLYPAGTGWTEMVRLRDLARDYLAQETGEPAFRYHTSDSLSRASGHV